MATSIRTINPAFPVARAPRGKRRLALAATALAIAASLGAAPAVAGWIGNVDLLTRGDGSVLPVYEKDGRKWVVGTPGQEYAIRVCNTTGARVLAVMSVDGVNVVSGETASPSQSGYVLDAWRMRRHQRLAEEPRVDRGVLFHRASRIRTRRAPGVPTTSASSASRSSASGRSPSRGRTRRAGSRRNPRGRAFGEAGSSRRQAPTTPGASRPSARRAPTSPPRHPRRRRWRKSAQDTGATSARTCRRRASSARARRRTRRSHFTTIAART